MVLLPAVQAQEITLDSLEDGPGILPFKLGPSKIVSHYHSFLQTIDIDNIKSKVELVKLQLNTVRPQLNNKTLYLYEPHIDYLSTKLNKISEQLETFEPNRVKRGLINGLGSIIKDISGNLDYTDALHYDNAIRSLQDNMGKLVSEYNSHISLSKEWMSEHTNILNNLTTNQQKIEQVLNVIMNSDATRDTDLIKYAHLAQLLLILGDNIEDLSEELTRLGNVIAFIRANSTHHSMLSLSALKSMLDRLQTLYSKETILEISLREYYDVIKVGSYYSNNQIVIIFKIPIASPDAYTLFKLSIVPNKSNQVLIPSSPYIAIHEQRFMYIETECPKTSVSYLCERKINYQPPDRVDCIHQLIIAQKIDATCEPTSVTLTREALEQLDDKHYVISLPNPTKIQLACEKNQYFTLQGSYLVDIPHNCYLHTPEFTITNSNDRTRGQVIKIMNLPALDESPLRSQEPRVKLNSINLENLHTSNTKISLTQPIEMNTTNESIYHTTIPMYVILLSATTIVIVIVARRYWIKKRSDTESIEMNPVTGDEHYAKITTCSRDNPDRTATKFSTKVLN